SPRRAAPRPPTTPRRRRTTPPPPTRWIRRHRRIRCSPRSMLRWTPTRARASWTSTAMTERPSTSTWWWATSRSSWRSRPTAPRAVPVSAADAIRQALDQHPGGVRDELELDEDDGALRWEIDLDDSQRGDLAELELPAT